MSAARAARPQDDSLQQVGQIIKHATQGAADGITALSASLNAMALTVAAGQEQLRISERARADLAEQLAAEKAKNLDVQRAADAARAREMEAQTRDLRYAEMFKLAGSAITELVPSIKAYLVPKLGASPPPPAQPGEPTNSGSAATLDDVTLETLCQMVVGALTPSTLLSIQNEAGADLMAALLRKISKQVG